MRFDLLVFESPLYGVSKAWQSIQQGQEPLAAVRPAIFGVWSRSARARDLFEYIGRAAKSPRPLALAGFGVQFMSPTRDNLLKELDALVARLGITSDVTTPGSEARTLAVNLVADRFGEKGLPSPDAAARKASYDGLEVLRNRVTDGVPTIEATIDPKDPQHGYTRIVTLGEEVWRRVGLEAFTIGFTCYEGRDGSGNPNDTDRGWLSAIRKDRDPSIELEELLNAARFDYALVSFRKAAAHGEWLKEPIISRPLGNQGMRAVWPNIMDAMFCTRVMEPNWITRPADDNRRYWRPPAPTAGLRPHPWHGEAAARTLVAIRP